MRKSELRSFYQKKRNALSEAEYFQLNHGLCENFFAHIDFLYTNVIHTFIPIEKKREPNTWLIIDRIRREFPQIRLSIPRVNDQTGELENFFFEGMHQLRTNTWGVPEPTQGIPTPPEKIDLVLVPLLCFDKQGYRVGYGKGFYDKFLQLVPVGCRRIGISLFPPVEKIDDIGSFDVPLDLCVTPDESFTFTF
jgi:5-formyltetrahydrofolate cyclo-ligase